MKKYVLLIAVALLCESVLLSGCEQSGGDDSATAAAAQTIGSTAVSSADDSTAEQTTGSTADTTVVTTALYDFFELTDNCEVVPEKPVIYLYPETPTDVQVKLDFNGSLSCTYPEYNGGWSVTAHPDGTLVDGSTGREYSYLFWEGTTDVAYDMSRGFVVKGEDTAAFFEEILPKMGLLPREYNEFIVYWLPQMQGNPYNLITFQTDVYTENAKLTVTPEPDSMLRVFMAYKALEEPVDIEEPVIEPFVRDGFCVVEWGGAEVK